MPRRRRRPSAAAFVAELTAAMPHPWVTYTIVAVNAVVFAVMVASGVSPIAPGVEELFAWGADYGPATAGGEWWRIVTCAFLHFGAVHLAANLWCLWVAGPLAERLLGHGVFTSVYLYSAIGGSLASLAWDPTIVSAGASGAVFGTYGALFACALRLRRIVPVAMFEHLRASAGVFVLFNVAYGMRGSNIDHAAHLGGLVAGIVGTWVLCRAPAEPTPHSPMLAVDWRMGFALVVAMAAGGGAVAWRVERSDIVRAERAALAAWDRGWQDMDRAEAAGRFDEALAHNEALLAIAPAEPALHGRRGFHLGSLGRHADALSATDRALALAGTTAMRHSNRAWSLAALGRHEEGVRAARRALELDPGLALARFNLLDCLHELGRHDELLREAEVAVAQHGGSPPAHAWVGRALSNLERYAEALAAIDHALALDPGHAWAREHRAWLLQQLPK